jgi:signal transduction histidine kinase
VLRVAQAAGRIAGLRGFPGPAVGRASGSEAAIKAQNAADSAPYAVLLPLAFQLAVLPAAALVFVGRSGVSGNGAVLALCAALAIATAGLGLGALRGVPVRLLVVADTALAVAGNLAMSAVALPSARAIEVTWQYFAGCVALWTLLRGVPAGLGATALGIAARVAMTAGAGVTNAHGPATAPAAFAGDVAVLLVAVVVAAGVSAVVERDAERLRTGMRRSLHDTVLQTLEAIALTLPNDAENAPRRLREVRAVAHAEAVALRRELSRRTEARPTPNVVEGLVALGAELARDGLRLRLDASEEVDGDDGLTPQRRAALLAATREALRNVLKHSGVAEALVRVWDGPDGLTVVVRDFGAGFDPAAHRPGFGLSESIAARLAEVGGTTGIGSRAGHGTSVTLWVPIAVEDLS